MNSNTLLRYLQKTKGVSRRDFHDMIKKELLIINNQTVTDMNQEVNIGDHLQIKLPHGQIYEEYVRKTLTFRPVIVAFNKPKGYAVSKEDKHNQTIYELLPESWKKDFYYIGRLDKDSHGLLLLTNQTEMVDFYENPKNNIYKIYEVQIDQPFKSKDIPRSKRGILVDEDGYAVDPKSLDKPFGTETLAFYDVHYSQNKGKHLLRILLDEGKNRHIRRLLSALGYRVKDLKRIKVGKYELGTIKPGQYKIYRI